MVGAAFALDAIHGRTRTLSLQPLLERGFVVAQRGAGAQLEGQLLGGLAHHLAADKGPHRVQTSIEKQGAHHCFHGIGKHRALATQAAALFAAAQAQMLAEADLLGHLRHVLPADQSGADAGELALVPLRMRGKQRLGHHQPQHGVAEKLEALVVGRRGLFTLICLRELVGQGAVGERAHQQLRVREPGPKRGFKLFEICFHARLGLQHFLGILTHFAASAFNQGVSPVARQRVRTTSNAEAGIIADLVLHPASALMGRPGQLRVRAHPSPASSSQSCSWPRWT